MSLPPPASPRDIPYSPPPLFLHVSSFLFYTFVTLLVCLSFFTTSRSLSLLYWFVKCHKKDFVSYNIRVLFLILTNTFSLILFFLHQTTTISEPKRYKTIENKNLLMYLETIIVIIYHYKKESCKYIFNSVQASVCRAQGRGSVLFFCGSGSGIWKNSDPNPYFLKEGRNRICSEHSDPKFP